eukprot:7420336-Lingulodinium_polyedra.AAC.1
MVSKLSQRNTTMNIKCAGSILAQTYLYLSLSLSRPARPTPCSVQRVASPVTRLLPARTSLADPT